MSRAVCPGSFDPATSGHLDVIERTARLFDEVVVAVGNNVAKNALFSPAERVDMLAEASSPGITSPSHSSTDCLSISARFTASAPSSKVCDSSLTSTMSCRWHR